MKKFMKGCAITVAVLLVLGIALAFTAGALRGGETISEVVERVTGGRVHANFNLGWGLPFGIFVDDSKWFSDDDWNYELDSSKIFDNRYEILSGETGGTGTIYPNYDGDITGLDITMGGGSFKTRVSETGSVYVSVSGMEKMQAYVESGVLYIKSLNTHVKLLSNYGKVTLYVPEDLYYDEVNIELGAGEMTFDSLNAEEISLKVGAGTIQCKNITAKELDVSVGMGQIELKGMDVDELDAEVGMGELSASGAIGRSAKLECSMGNVEMKLDGSRQDYNYQLKAAAGNIDIGRESYSGLATQRRIDNNASKTLDIECSMGNISIRFTE